VTTRAVVREQILPTCRLARFATTDGCEEVHLFVEPDTDGPFADQLERVVAIYHRALETLGLARHTVVLRRCFLSDAANQLEMVMASPLGTAAGGAEAAALSCLQQAPLPYHKIALQAYHVSDVRPDDKSLLPVPGAGAHAATLRLRRAEQTLLWSTQLTAASNGDNPCCCEQTRALFRGYDETLAAEGATLRDDTVRTWLFVHDVDNNYEGMVRARRELFEEAGLTDRTHYIVSTGIEGRTERADSLVMLDALAIPGLDGARVRYLDALDHLNRTSDYGVTFERAARLDHGDRSHLLISGTASIDAAGDVVHVGDVVGQAERTLENISSLLEAGGAHLDDMATMTVYLRDPADAGRVRSLLDNVGAALPYTMVHAPVCRPGWLIEIEGLAIVANQDARWPRY